MNHGELEGIKAENERLIALLEQHGIEWRLPPPLIDVVQESAPSRLSPTEKVALFIKLFRGRPDVYPVRWERKTAGKSGYTPACANEWRAGICEKPRIKCSDCCNRQLSPLSDNVIYDHLAGRHTVGVYPLLADGSCHFLAIDFDEADWRERGDRRGRAPRRPRDGRDRGPHDRLPDRGGAGGLDRRHRRPPGCGR